MPRDDLNEALWRRVNQGVEQDGWTLVSLGSLAGLPLDVRGDFLERLELSDVKPSQIVLAVFVMGDES